MPFQLVPAGTHYDFIGKRRIAVSISVACLAVSLIAVFVNGVKWGIDFAGGTEMQVLFSDSVAVDEGAIRAVVGSCGIDDFSVVRYGESDVKEFLIRFAASDVADATSDACPLTPEQLKVMQAARESGGGGGESGEKGETIDKLTFAMENSIGSLEVQRIEFVGPRVGAELRTAGVRSILVASLMILAYIAFRFSVRFAPGAIVALLHDVGITAGIFVILGLEFDLRVLAALLAIMGYSLNDTIIIYDRIRENMELRTKVDFIDVLNRSVNQTLARTVLTSGTTMTVILALWILGGEVIRPFAMAMAIGIVVGTYSSIFIASPTLLLLENRFGARISVGASRSTGIEEGVGDSNAAFVSRRDAAPRAASQTTSRKKRSGAAGKRKKRR